MYDDAAAKSLIRKLREFTNALDEDERVMLGQLLAPGIAGAYPEDGEVTGFAATRWGTDTFAEALARAVRAEGLRVVWGEPLSGS
ncbi:MAG: hypothetical protein M0020_05025 [Actinomycetota bacterium]|nr:hypothetical protein [Actinomycetota bacterium]